MDKSTGRPGQDWTSIDEVSALRTLNQFAVDLIGIPSAEDLFWYVAQNVVGKLSFVDCVIYQANPAMTQLTQVAAWGEKNPFARNIINPLVIPFGHGITGLVAASGEAIVVRDLMQDRNYIPDTAPARSEICVPIMCGGQVAGVIDSEHPVAGAFGDPEREILSTVAAMTGAKLELLAEAERSHQRYTDLVASHAQLSHEISTRKALETKLFEARKREALGRLTGRFAHELNNILTAILGNLDLLQSDPTGAESGEYLAETRKAADRAAALMQDMLTYAQRTRLTPQTVDIDDTITAFFAAQPATASAPVRLDLEGDIWPVSVDPHALDTIIGNLVANARYATRDAGEVVMKTGNLYHDGAKPLVPGVELPPGRYVTLSVGDTGTGMPDVMLSQIFDPFFTMKPTGTGTGLGLSIVNGLVQQSGGKIGCVSDAGKGSTFTIYFPAARQTGNFSLSKIY